MGGSIRKAWRQRGKLKHLLQDQAITHGGDGIALGRGSTADRCGSIYGALRRRKAYGDYNLWWYGSKGCSGIRGHDLGHGVRRWSHGLGLGAVIRMASQPEVTISDLVALKQSEEKPAQDFITELEDKASKYEELLREEQQKRNYSKGTYYKTPSSSVHLVEVESEDDQENTEEVKVAVAKIAKLKDLISCKALTKSPKDQKPPPFIGGFVPNKPAQNKVYSFDKSRRSV
ncbi:hypothetical protein L3X38_003902 [Prunus dulcis]|uniref:Uncharacterized protein n=1 Tax=Prunus dulcis TaxID=3755 RepID=A0AAD4ZN02_PRUDU|nr:hypothetical protein L3X38_003902 [Prunus dulcis]